ncbi:hypothetical protein [Rhodococcus wratislaviensis]|uniref:hypothetical protein n=1 Tax=Rhodococcus wratislaviensis TaxID=44752 RepID=UPI00364E7037
MRVTQRDEFLTNHPFAELVSLGWRLRRVGRPLYRAGAKMPIRTALFSDAHDRAITFDVDYRGWMSDHATYAAGNLLLVADTPATILALAISSPVADVAILRQILDVHEFHL